MKFVDVKNDVAFRKIFGNENKKEILISFLNAVLQLKGDNRIKSIVIANPYQMPILPNLKASIIDVKARDHRDNTFIIEMQVADILAMDIIPDNIDDEGLREAYFDANKNSWTQAELDAYNYAAMREQDDRGRIAVAEIKALQKGREEGEEKREVELVIEMYRDGLSNDRIAKIAKISSAKVEEIIANHT
jgi:PD-(D/E)XK nuclease family transposase